MPSGREGSVSQPSSLSGRNSTSTEEEDSIASALSCLSIADGLQSPAGSIRSTKSVRSTNSNTSSRSRARNPLRTNARGYAEPILIEFVADIEDNGGLQYILGKVGRLSKFCEQRFSEGKESIYGRRKTSEREKVLNKIRLWGKLPEEEWKDILLYCQVTPAALRPGSVAQPPSVVSVPAESSRREPTPRASRRTPASAEADSTPRNSNVRASRGGFKNYRKQASVLSSSDEDSPQPCKTLFANREKMAQSIQRPDDIPIEPITVDVDNLELTPYPFKVKRIFGMIGTKEEEKYQGYVITMHVDPNDALGVDSIGLPEFPYEAKVYSDTEIDVVAPMLEFNERGGHDNAIRAKLANHDESNELIDSMDNARKRYERKYGTVVETTKKTYRLKFTGPVILSAKVLKVNEDETDKKAMKTGGYTIMQDIEALKQTPTVLKQEVNKAGTTTVTMMEVRFCVPKLYWRVADTHAQYLLSGASQIKAGGKGTAASRALLGQSGASFVMPQLANELSLVRVGKDPPTSLAVSSGVVVPMVVSSGPVPMAVPSGPVPIALTSSTGVKSSLSEAVKNAKPESPHLKSLEEVIEEGKADVRKGLSMFEGKDGLSEFDSDDNDEQMDDAKMDDAKDNKKRDHGYSQQAGQSGLSDQGELLAPFPLQPNPTEFVRINLSSEDHAAVLSVPLEERQEWLLDYLKGVLLKFSEEDRAWILSHRKSDRFSAMKELYEIRQP